MHSLELIELAKAKRRDGLSYGQIAKDLNLKKSAIFYMVTNNYEKPKKKSGPRALIDDRVTRQIVRAAKSRIEQGLVVSSNKLISDLQIDISKWTMSRVLRSQGFKYLDVLKSIPLTPRHKEARLAAARHWIATGHPWIWTIATDEKRFCKDGNDNEKSWLQDANCSTLPNRKKRQMKGGGVMVWGAITADGHYKLIRVRGKVKGVDYLKMINEEVVPWMNVVFPNGNYNFLQDNAAIHTARVVMSNFKDKNIRVLDWPARSPDLNVIENWWWMLSQKVYERGSFDSDDLLWKAIEEAAEWYHQNKREHFKNLFNSMGRRLLEVIDNDGGMTRN